MLRSDPPRGTRMETLELTAAELREFTDLSSPGEQDEWVAERVPHEVITWNSLEIRGALTNPSRVACDICGRLPPPAGCPTTPETRRTAMPTEPPTDSQEPTVNEDTMRLYGVGPRCPGCGGPTHAVTGDKSAENPWWCKNCNARLNGDGEPASRASFPAGADPDDTEDER